MPTILQSKHAKGILPSPYPHAANAVCRVRAEIALTANPTANDIAEMIILPANMTVVDAILDSDDVDTNGTPTITMDVGVMSGTPGSTDGARTCGAEIFSAATVGQTGAVARPTLKSAFRIGKSDKDRSIGIKFGAVAATFAAGTVGLTILLSD